MRDWAASRRAWLALAGQAYSAVPGSCSPTPVGDPGAFFALAERWRLTDSECAALLSIPVAVVSAWRSGMPPAFSAPMFARAAYALGIDGLLTTLYCSDVRPVDVLQQPRSDSELVAFSDGIRIVAQLHAERADRWTGGGRLLDYVLAPQPGALEAAYSYIATITL